MNYRVNDTAFYAFIVPWSIVFRKNLLLNLNKLELVMGIFGSSIWYCRKLSVAPEYLSLCSIKFYIVVITFTYFPSSSSVLFISVIQSVNGGEF